MRGILAIPDLFCEPRGHLRIERSKSFGGGSFRPARRQIVVLADHILLSMPSDSYVECHHTAVEKILLHEMGQVRQTTDRDVDAVLSNMLIAEAESCEHHVDRHASSHLAVEMPNRLR